jgi:hypothetical protein
LGIKEERATEGSLWDLLLSMHVGADRTLSHFDCGGSDGAVTWADRARCYGNAHRYDPHRRARRGRFNFRSGRRRIPVKAEKVKHSAFAAKGASDEPPGNRAESSRRADCGSDGRPAAEVVPLKPRRSGSERRLQNLRRAGQPATLNNGVGVLTDCPTLQEAVLAWHRLPSEQKVRATVKVIGGPVFHGTPDRSASLRAEAGGLGLS